MSLITSGPEANRAFDARRVAGRFPAHFTSLKFNEAARFLSKYLLWFSKPISADDCAQQARAGHGSAQMQCELVGELTSDLLRQIPSEVASEVFDGCVRDSDHLAMYDLCRYNVWVSIGVLLSPDSLLEKS